MAGKLEKLKIHAYMDKKFNEEYDNSPFTVKVNPEQYSLNHRIKYDEDQEPGKSANDESYIKTLPDTLQFEFLLDQTGAFENTAETEHGVEDQVAEFKKFTLNYEGEIHQPKFLKLAWGTLIFYCRLTELEVSYELFNEGGSPLRARLKTSFKQFKENLKRGKEENDQSPDTSKVRMIKENDKLPLLAQKFYGNVNYSSEIAKSNQLKGLRNIKTGTQLKFPPIKK